MTSQEKILLAKIDYEQGCNMKDYKNILFLKDRATLKIEAVIFCNEEGDIIEDEIQRIKQEYYDKGIDSDYMFTELEYIFFELCNKYDIDYYMANCHDEICY